MTPMPADFDPGRFLAGFAAAERFRGRRPLRLHLGPGPVRLPGWVRVSSDPAVGDLDLDLRLALPFDDASVAAIYGWAVPDDLGERLVALAVEARRVLEPGGRIRLVGRDRRSLEAEVRHLALQGVVDLDRIKALPYWAAADVVALLEAAGFASVEQGAIDASADPEFVGLESQHGLGAAEGGSWFVVEAVR